MPVRDRLKKVFRRSGGLSDTSSFGKLSKSSTKRDSNVYQPGEKMPPMKYRRPVAKEHKEKLESFSFASAWRRRSDASQYSPFGSRMPSRRNSMRSRKSFQAQRNEARAPNDTVGSTGQIVEGVDEETDLANVGLSRQHTREDGAPTPGARTPYGRRTPGTRTPRGLGSRTPGTRSPHIRSGAQSPNPDSLVSSGGSKPFTEEDLALAMKRSHLDVPTAKPA